MKKSVPFVFVSCLIASGLARPPVFLGYQDSLGQYSFGYSAPGSARSEVRTSNGATRGTYSYVDETGVIQTAQYVADGENGFRVIATNLPQAPLPVQDTPEVMAARTAHLQAVEQATKREETETQSREKNVEIAKEIEGSPPVEVNPEARELPETKSAEGTSKEEEKPKTLEDVDATKSSGENLQAVASKSGVDQKNEKDSQDIREEFSSRASQIVHANIPAIPLISPQVLLPQAADQVPVFRISHGNHEIEPSAIPESSIAQGASGVITPAGTALKSAAVPTWKAASEKKQTPSHGSNEQAGTANTLVAPLNVIPWSSSYSSFVRYISPASLHYVTYNVL